MRAIFYSLFLSLLSSTPARADKPEPPRTVAEKTDHKETSRHADVTAFCELLPKLSPTVRLEALGTSHEGRKLPLLLIADPPVKDAAEAVKQGRTVVLLVGNIHGGEVDGKEALLMLARELATTKSAALKEGLIVAIVPLLNADGNEKVSDKNRKSQNGPPEVGTRANGQGLDLNRDFVKLESPELRALVKWVNEWDPAVVLDMHTTNGSLHRYLVTYDGPRHPAADPKLIAASQDVLLPAVAKKLKEEKIESFDYGYFSRDRKQWLTYPALPRFGIQYLALRNRIALLCESYSYAEFKDRVRGSLAFARACLDEIAAKKDTIRAVLREAREGVVRSGKTPRGDDEIALRFSSTPQPRPVTILGYVEETKDGKVVSTGQPKEYEVEFPNRCKPTLSVRRPFAYLYPASLTNLTEVLQRHGIEVQELREEIELDVETYKIDKVNRELTEFQKHKLTTVDATARKESKRLPAGTILVRTGQPLGTLAAFLLEPQSEDGLCAWNFLDDHLKEGKDFPVARLPAVVPVLSIRLKPLPEDRPAKRKPITMQALDAGELPSFSGSPVSVMAWLEDGEHFLQYKDNQLYKVQARTGRAAPFLDHAKYQKSLATIPGMPRPSVSGRARSGSFAMNPQRTGTLIEQGDDLWFCPFDGTKSTRLTKGKGRSELPTFSPDGKWVAFVRANNLYAVDLATQTEKQLTRDGSEVVFNGRADWVYYEEVFSRSRKTYWWSPDSSHLAFLRFDDTPVKKFSVADLTLTQPRVETTAYPKAGDPNPLVKVGVVSLESGPAKFVEKLPFPDASAIVLRVGWVPDSQTIWFYALDRAQTQLAFCTAGRDGGECVKLFTDSNKGWIDDPGSPHFLKDGSFLFPSERTGWKHVYHYDARGKLKGAVTGGEWDVKDVSLVDEENGWVYFTGTRENLIAANLYRVKLDGGDPARLTPTSGEHRVQVGPRGDLFIDSWSDRKTPTKVMLRNADGTPARTLDTNPVYSLDEYEFLPVEHVQIKTPDGFLLEATVVEPPKGDTTRRHPVWLKVYGGPGMPTIGDGWRGGNVEDQALARLGYVVFRCDPRCASGKGACSAWTAYKQLGVQETKDLETAVKWLCQRPTVDPARVGISGHSYGGYLTAYAMTHSKVFAAGIAGAPVTDWRNYDTIYTERYMRTPKENEEGYNRASVVKAAKDLHGRLLILHGLVDDNVHFQNTAQLVDALQRANKEFEMMLYPRSRHGLFGAHYRKLTMDFMKKNLKPEQ